jgi:Amt family ammonium transporter
MGQRPKKKQMNRAFVMFVAWTLLGLTALLVRLGVALYHGGVCRSKNAGSGIYRGIMDISVGILAFWAFGAAVQSGVWGELFSVGRQTWGLFGVAMVLIASSAVVGSTMERSRPLVPFLGSVLMCGLVAPLGWQWARGSFLQNMGFVDLGGATFIHFAAGCAALATAITVGARSGKYNKDGSTNIFPGHSVVLASAGVMLVLVGWIPYMVGCFLLNGGSVSSSALYNVLLGGAAGAVASVVYSRLRHAKVDVYLVCSGLLGGLVSTTAAADKLLPAWAVAAGAVAGIIIPWFANWMDLVWKIDDPGGAVAIQGMGGLWAALVAAIFLPGTAAMHLHRLAAQGTGLGLMGALSLGSFFVVMIVARVTVGLRCNESDEFDGLDLGEHDLNAYPDFQQTMIKSYHLRQI